MRRLLWIMSNLAMIVDITKESYFAIKTTFITKFAAYKQIA